MRVKRSIDPSKTILLRRQFANAMRRRFVAVRKTITASDFEDVELFRGWMIKGIDEFILSYDDGITPKPWIAIYIESAYKKGLLRSYADVNKGGVLSNVNWFGGAKTQFLKSTMGRTEINTHIDFLVHRAYHLLEGATDDMMNKMTLTLENGLTRKDSPKKIAKDLAKVIKDVYTKRVLLIVRTEIVHAHAEGQLDGFEILDVEKVGAEVELNVSKGREVCKQCKKLEGVVLTIEKARGLIPIHPDCLCAWGSAMDESLLKKT